MRDGKNNILKIGDKIQNAKGEIKTLENIGGVSMAVQYGDRREILKATILRKLNMSEWELV